MISGSAPKAVSPFPLHSDKTPEGCFPEINISLEASARLTPSGTARQQPESQLGSQEERDLLK